jgi:Derlin-2/3
MADVFGWYSEIPIISRCYLTSAFAITTACFLDLISPLTLYYNYDLIMTKGQYWRLISSFLFFGTFSLDFVFHMYFVLRYCRLLEEGSFRGRSADFLFLIIYGMVFMLIVTTLFDTFARIKFLGHPLTFMMVYLWSRDPENAHIQLSFLGVLQFTAPYLPWVLLSFSLLIGNPVEMDLLGIFAGHIYYFLDYIYPQIAHMRNWNFKKLVFTPPFLHYLFSSEQLFAYLNTRVSVCSVTSFIVYFSLLSSRLFKVNHLPVSQL